MSHNLLAYDNEDAVAIYSGDSSDDGENAAAIRANYPIPSQCKLFYFEVEIIDKGKNGYVGYIFLFPSQLGMATVGHGWLSVGHSRSKIFDRPTVVITETLTVV